MKTMDDFCKSCANINVNVENMMNQCYFCKRITSVRFLDVPYNYKQRGI